MGIDDRELIELLKTAPKIEKSRTVLLRERAVRAAKTIQAGIMEDEEDGDVLGNLCQWTTADDSTFFPASTTRNVLPPGAYEICQSQSGLYFEKVSVKTTDLVRFPDANSDRVIEEIKLFWNSKARFEKFKMPYKRGICLWGPPGSGKSCTVQFVMKDVIDREGIVIKFSHPDFFLRGYRMLREIQPETPVVVIIEDIDSILDDWSESSVLNILDGAVDSVENVVFLATTNYPEKLGKRVINRPSRFDRRFKIGFPTAECRRIYFKHLLREHSVEEDVTEIEKWVKDTDNMSVAHLRELFVAVTILGNDYDESISILKTMDESISSDQDGGTGLGFS